MATNNTQSDFSLVATELREGEFVPPKTSSIVSNVVDIIAVNGYGVEILFEDSARICLEVNDTSIAEDSCLGFYNEEDQIWECEDPCLEQDNDGQLCGSTSHFTSFAVLFQGTGAGRCDKSSTNNIYILGEPWKDSLLIVGVTLGILLCAGLIVIFSFTPVGRVIILGDEGHRIFHVRETRKVISSRFSESNEEQISQ